ncbi:PAS domain S-box protein [Desulfovibrio sp. TomC]|uniref:PAS domain S-box protein n=1 Tax=Desulfovibrio sp. TomC TaxID=1562888 RepID=UPI0005749B2C|nr:PAS domain S-box protein [Desulfovibrio sp. TomC]KHK01509.1 sensory box histidine kinase/response regulator [Desulfovibrio sp. TomC]
MAESQQRPVALTLDQGQSLYEKAPVMFHSIDKEGRLLSVNALWRRVLGYEAHDVIGRHLGEFMTEASRGELNETLPLFIREGRVTEKAYQMVAGDGRILDVLLSAVGEYDASGAFIRSLAAIKDITERRRTERALAKSEELFRLAFENANEGMTIVGIDGRFLRVNEALCHFFGYDEATLLGKTVNDVAASGAEAVSPRHISLALAGVREQFRFEKRYRHASGKEIWGRVSSKMVRGEDGEPLYFISHVLDVTAVQQSAEQLTLHANTLEALLLLGRMREADLEELGRFILARGVELTASSGGMAAMSNSQTGDFVVLAATAQALEVFGLPESTQRFTAAEAPALFRAGQDGPFQIGDAAIRQLVVPMRDDPATVLLLAVMGRATPYGDDDTRRLTLLGEGVLGHVKERCRELDLTRARQQAEAASQAKSGFLANMSHEIRTPLSGIIGLAQMTLTQNPRPELRENLELILDSSRSLLGIVNDILDFSKIEAGKMEFLPVDFDPRDTLDRTMKPFQFSARQKGLTLDVHIDPQVPAMVHGDPDRIMQVVRNLVGNALKFTDQGEVEVSLALARPGDPMLVACTVRDTGIGIPEDRHHELFQVFSQLESTRTKRFGGTGLGLAISRRLVEMMGGGIDVESVPGQGSTFSFTVSLRPASETPQEVERPQGMSQAGGFAGLKVLLAEDNQVNRLFLKHFLSEAGCQVRLAGSGTQALEQLCQEPADLVLMDIQMPEMDGAEATRRIRAGEAGEAARGMPVVALTAYSMKGDRERFLSVGLDDYVSKPVDVDELFMVMRRVLDRPGGNERPMLPAAPAMDMAYYEERGKTAFAREICRMFLEESPQVVASLEQAVREENWEAAGDAAHSLLGMAVPLRARALTEGARRLQEAGLSGDADGCREACRLVSDELDRVQAAIRDLLE